MEAARRAPETRAVAVVVMAEATAEEVVAEGATVAAALEAETAAAARLEEVQECSARLTLLNYLRLPSLTRHRPSALSPMW